MSQGDAITLSIDILFFGSFSNICRTRTMAFSET